MPLFKDRKAAVPGNRYSEQIKSKPMIRPYGGASTAVPPVMGRKATNVQSISSTDSTVKDNVNRPDNKNTKGKTSVHMDLPWGSSCSVCKYAFDKII